MGECIVARRGSNPKGTATPNKVLQGETFESAAGRHLVGTIPKLSARTITPGTSDQQVAAGNYLNGALTVKGDSNLKGENIVQGASIFGVAGSAAKMEEQTIRCWNPYRSGTYVSVMYTIDYIDENGKETSSRTSWIANGGSGYVTILGKVTGISLSIN